MTKIHSYIPITSLKSADKGNCSQFFSSFFYYNTTRFVIVENKGKGHLVLMPYSAPKQVAHKGLKIALLFTGIVPLFAGIWAFCRFLHVKCSKKKWTLVTDPAKLPPQLNGALGANPNNSGTQKAPLALDRHAGIINQRDVCWFNSELQVLAHFKHIRALFSPKENPLKQRDTESKADFELRQQIQQQGHAIIESILSGNNGTPIDAEIIHKFGLLVFQAKLSNGSKLIWESNKKEFFGVGAKALLPKSFISYLSEKEQDPTMICHDISKVEWYFNHYSKNNSELPKQIIHEVNMLGLDQPLPNEITSPNGQVYTLQAAVTGGGHAVTYIRNPEGVFVKFDDRTVENTGLKELKAHQYSYYYYLPKPIPEPIPLTQHAGIENQRAVCWFNSELQVIAHTPHLRNLFSPHLNPLKKGNWESDEAFKLRQQIQEKGRAIIDAILSGNNKQAVHVEELGELLVQAKFSNGQKLIGMDVFNGLYPPAQLPRKLIPYLSGTEIVEQSASNDSFQSLSLGTIDDIPRVYQEYVTRNTTPPKQILITGSFLIHGKVLPKKVMPLQGGPTYVLQSAVGGLGHAIAYIRDKDGSFIKFDDSRVEETGIKEFTAADGLQYYYVSEE